MPLDLEKEYYSKKVKYIVGTDEAGRGCLLGPVFAAAVILPKDFSDPLINDSKQLTAKQREKAFDIIINNAIAYSISSVGPEEIDEINILVASRLAMKKAIDSLNHKYDLILTDAMKIPGYDVPVIDVVHGDALSKNIAAASILAKVSRDRLCEELDKQYPEYGIKKHKGYGTKNHMEALKKYGPVKGLHRFSYAPIKELFLEKVTLF
ncbi:MAG: ribonuclease HII [Bacilli bacterium]|nr:ribonuclease HII [Bacilli bacterium]